jgi:hypothetical protein
MFRKMIPLAVAIVLVVGCKKKEEEGGGGGGGGAQDGKIDSDPNTSYTIRLREEMAGDVTDVVESGTRSTDVNSGKAQKPQEVKKLEYTENIIDMPAGSRKPTKLTRAYKVAQQFDERFGSLKALPYEGKKVTIEKTGETYQASIDGEKLTRLDSRDLLREFNRPYRTKFEEMFPKYAVKIGDTWNGEPAALKDVASGIPVPIDTSKSKITGKLTRAPTRDGKQWGLIEFDCDLAPGSPGGGKGNWAGTIKITGTLDVVIDGTSRTGTWTLSLKMDLTRIDGGENAKFAVDQSLTRTVKSAK